MKRKLVRIGDTAGAGFRRKPECEAFPESLDASARARLGFLDGDFMTLLFEFVRGTQSCQTAADDQDTLSGTLPLGRSHLRNCLSRCSSEHLNEVPATDEKMLRCHSVFRDAIRTACP